MDFGDVGCDFGSKAQTDVVDAAFGNHRPCTAEVIGEVKVIAIVESLVEDVGFFDPVELEGSNRFVDRRVADTIPGALVIEDMQRRQDAVNSGLVEERVVVDFYFSPLRDGRLYCAEYTVEREGAFNGGLCAGFCGDSGQGMPAIVSDSGGQGTFDFKGGKKGGSFERELNLASHFVDEKQDCQGLLQVEVNWGEKLFGCDFVTLVF